MDRTIWVRTVAVGHVELRLEIGVIAGASGLEYAWQVSHIRGPMAVDLVSGPHCFASATSSHELGSETETWPLIDRLNKGIAFAERWVALYGAEFAVRANGAQGRPVFWLDSEQP